MDQREERERQESGGLEYADDVPNSSSEASVPWGDDVIQDQEMLGLGLVVYLPLHILICIGCKTVVDPKGIYDHVRGDRPSVQVTKSYCLSLEKRFSLTPKAGLEAKRPLLRSAIPCLKIREGLVRCTECNHAMEHKRSFHGAHSCTNSTIVSSLASQSFFPHEHQGRYFGVTLPTQPREEHPVDVVQAFKDAFPNPSPANVPIRLPDDAREANHFLATQNWIPALDGLTGGEIEDVIKGANPDLRPLVSAAITRYIFRVAKGLEDIGSHSPRVSMGSYTGLAFVHQSLVSRDR